MVTRDSDHCVIALQTADSSSRQRGPPTETGPQISDNLPRGSNIWSQVPEWARHLDILTELIVSRKVSQYTLTISAAHSTDNGQEK
jgi:hypothetical protein